MEFSEQKIGEQFQEETKYARSPHWPISSAKKSLPRPLKPSSPQLISLSQPHLDNGPNLWKVLLHRRSIREYSQVPLSLEELSNLLWATQGITAKASLPWYRTAPSAGALHPIDSYLVVNRVERLEPGIYFLRVQDFSLEVKNKGDFSRQIAQAALDQQMAQAAAVVFVWVGVIRRCRQKYRQRAYRYVYLDCGHLGQNLYLAATAMNLGCCGIAAFYDDEVNELVGVDGHEETAIYLATVGRKESSSNTCLQ
ncbi:MAG: SagB/ThcOx family dehydrogenase [Deltaproteobacteria bacterium]|nr:SagB/ThcOx family dehydrogenase [Deltaproteobacteria bacterium]